MTTRYNLQDFALANPIYTGATVSFYTVSAGVKTSTLATLYSASTGTATASNPQTLDSDGKLSAPVYIEVPTIATVSGLTISDHDTGIIGLIEDAAADSATAAAASAVAAASSASSAATAKTNAETAETNAELAETNAEAAQAAAEATIAKITPNSKTADYTCVLGDAGESINHAVSDNNPRTFTIPANASVAYDTGTVLTFINLINTVTIAITSDTMTLAGTASTGSRTLAVNGIATAIKVGATSWLISGTGLS